ncbi:uncharacterized protein ASPGLDRAFT_63031 [Aspergillus glaucus CBS 516.65]|uniref:Uncharacterized protein n=1 Tax=Aspergillus glaucus CBS 516.65 TaxID=1160497 RepID=A0A1L9W061_ASPGL|nr:hypothetical protein ASPGLDRAFT_63031 [Aspergillus glaucus CBS 516.65]OJJ89558.1 hypothetical protein ASPGLDRAFT_63031 [Aspergillus glaucus CBS 516.65]
MIFYRNGVDEMFLRRIFDARTNITAVTQWKSLDLEKLGQICIDSHDASQDQQKTQIIAQFDLKITLTTHNRNLHEDLRSAYRPHTYTVRLEKGMRCMPRAAYESMAASMYSQSYAYRLVFDKSPCPLRFGRTDTEEAPESLFLALAEWREILQLLYRQVLTKDLSM